MLGKLKKSFSKKETLIIPAPMAGAIIPIQDVPDPTFAQEILGKGIAIQPTGGRVIAPVHATVEQMFDTGHAVSLLTDDGVELLIHVGLDTVTLHGKHYTACVQNGQRVRPGDILLRFDRGAIIADGYDIITPIVVCNTASFASISFASGISLELEELITLTGKICRKKGGSA